MLGCEKSTRRKRKTSRQDRLFPIPSFLDFISRFRHPLARCLLKHKKFFLSYFNKKILAKNNFYENLKLLIEQQNSITSINLIYFRHYSECFSLRETDHRSQEERKCGSLKNSYILSQIEGKSKYSHLHK